MRQECCYPLYSIRKAKFTDFAKGHSQLTVKPGPARTSATCTTAMKLPGHRGPEPGVGCDRPLSQGTGVRAWPHPGDTLAGGRGGVCQGYSQALSAGTHLSRADQTQGPERLDLACQSRGVRTAASPASVSLSGRKQRPLSGVTVRSSLTATVTGTAALLPPSTPERDGGGARTGKFHLFIIFFAGGRLRAWGPRKWLQKGPTDLSWKQVLEPSDYRPSMWGTYAP